MIIVSSNSLPACFLTLAISQKRIWDARINCVVGDGIYDEYLTSIKSIAHFNHSEDLDNIYININNLLSFFQL